MDKKYFSSTSNVIFVKKKVSLTQKDEEKQKQSWGK